MTNTDTKKPLTSIAILGMGRSGRAVLARAVALGMNVVCFDDNHAGAVAEHLFKGPDTWPWPTLDAVIISPGIPHEHPAPHPAVMLANTHDVEVISEVEFALRTGRHERIIAITGTNGKSTTTALTGHILKQAGLNATIGGNIGDPLTGLPEQDRDAIIILELSSYQLETTPSLRAEIRVILNITPDHLDRHGGWDGYVRAKQAMITTAGRGDLVILGPGGPLDQLAVDNQHHDQIIRLDAHTWAGRPHNPALPGPHNQQNCAAARTICHRLGLADDIINKGIYSFAALPHRLQPVGQFKNIRFINDSKATNGQAAAKALASFSRIHWCAGGLAKEDGLSACLPHLSNVCHGYFYGQSADAFLDTVGGRIAASRHDTLEQAVGKAAAAAAQHPEDEQIILLSPAAASFDQFTSFESRGEAFCALAGRLLNRFQTAAPAPQKEAGHV